MKLTFVRKVAGIHTAQINATRELVVRKAGSWGWRVSIRDIGTKGLGTDLRLTCPNLGDAKIQAATFAGSLVTL